MSSDTSEISRREQARAIYQAAIYRPILSAGIVLLSLVAAILEGIGLSFLLPVIALAEDPEGAREAGGETGMFVEAFTSLGLPLTLEFVIVGAAVVMTARFTASFLVAWLRSLLGNDYIRHLQKQAYDLTLDAEVSYFDEQGSDDILNTIVTESNRAGGVITQLTKLLEQSFIALMYLGIALIISPVLTVLAAVLLGGITYLLRWTVESGSDIGNRVAEANRRIHESAQAGMQGIRDVKLFGMRTELYETFEESVDERTRSDVKLNRNQAGMDKFYKLTTAVTLFVLIYWALAFAEFSLAALGVFLFAIFRLAPRASNLNQMVYSLEGQIPHLYRTQQFLDELERRQEPESGDEPVPDTIDEITFEDVSFSYSTGETIFTDLSFSINGDEFAAFVGSSGAGKSTIAALVTRMYEPDSGEIHVNGTPISEFDIDEWRSRVSIVRQHPFIFNETLRRNVTIANREATDDEIERVCEIAQVTEFLDDLPDGYDTMLGEEGVRLSGGQKQRVALARALLKDAELLVLDEATSDLDANIEDTVHQGIEAMDRDYAMLVIAHRLSTVINADCIYAVENGEIVESGSHDELIGQGGTYSELYETQAQSV
jgi:subfamily B ATP-binding cassette protein MsbA